MAGRQSIPDAFLMVASTHPIEIEIAWIFEVGLKLFGLDIDIWFYCIRNIMAMLLGLIERMQQTYGRRLGFLRHSQPLCARMFIELSGVFYDVKRSIRIGAVSDGAGHQARL